VVRFITMADDPQDGKKGGTLGDLVKAESMVQMALALPAGCFIGYVIGAALDKHFYTGWMVIAGVLLGAVGGFTAIFRMASRAMKRDG
jgi:ATP synthase protein I